VTFIIYFTYYNFEADCRTKRHKHSLSKGCFPLHTRHRITEAVLNEKLGLHNKPKAAVHLVHKLTGPKKKKKKNYCANILMMECKWRFKKEDFIVSGDRGSTVVKGLCYKSEGRWFNSRWCHRNFSLT